MANAAFMEGAHAAKKGVKVNPYHFLNDKVSADLWDLGYAFGLDQCTTTE